MQRRRRCPMEAVEISVLHMVGGKDQLDANSAMMMTAAATVSLTGSLSLQGRKAAQGLELWAVEDEVELHVVDDASSAATAR